MSTDSKFFGAMDIEYTAHGLEADEDPVGQWGIELGVGTVHELVSWARMQRKNEQFFPRNDIVAAVWLTCIRTVEGRIPWGDDAPLLPFIIILEGELPAHVLEDHEDANVQVIRVSDIN